MISSYADLKTFCQNAQQQGTLALDTEFQRERRYSPDLQLVQVATPREAHLIDPLALPDLMPLWELVADPEVEVVLHDASQDLEIFFRLSGLIPRRIVDTQVAAAMIGLGEQPGYATVAEQLLGVKLGKRERVTDWSRRPLSARQADYALDDVRYLHPMRDRLMDELRRRGRQSWFEVELRSLEDVSRFQADPEALWARVAGRGNLDGAALAVLRELAVWREQAAEEANIPRRHVLADDILIDLCRRLPTTVEDLHELRRLTRGQIQRYGEALVEAVGRGRACRRDLWPQRPREVRLGEEYTGLIELLMLYVRLRSRDLAIATNYLATARDIKDFVGYVIQGELTEEGGMPRVLEGWRARLVGREMQEIVDGKLSLGFDRRRGDLVLYDDFAEP